MRGDVDFFGGDGGGAIEFLHCCGLGLRIRRRGGVRCKGREIFCVLRRGLLGGIGRSGRRCRRSL